MTKLFRGRRFHPAALALMIVTASSGWNRTFSDDVDFSYHLVGMFALIVATMFMVAWWANLPRVMRWAFLGSAWLWLFIAGTSYMLIHSIPSAVSAIGWAILAGGSFWEESKDREPA